VVVVVVDALDGLRDRPRDPMFIRLVSPVLELR